MPLDDIDSLLARLLSGVERILLEYLEKARREADSRAALAERRYEEVVRRIDECISEEDERARATKLLGRPSWGWLTIYLLARKLIITWVLLFIPLLAAAVMLTDHSPPVAYALFVFTLELFAYPAILIRIAGVKTLPPNHLKSRIASWGPRSTLFWLTKLILRDGSKRLYTILCRLPVHGWDGGEKDKCSQRYCRMLGRLVGHGIGSVEGEAAGSESGGEEDEALIADIDPWLSSYRAVVRLREAFGAISSGCRALAANDLGSAVGFFQHAANMLESAECGKYCRRIGLPQGIDPYASCTEPRNAVSLLRSAALYISGVIGREAFYKALSKCTAGGPLNVYAMAAACVLRRVSGQQATPTFLDILRGARRSVEARIRVLDLELREAERRKRDLLKVLSSSEAVAVARGNARLLREPLQWLVMTAPGIDDLLELLETHGVTLQSLTPQKLAEALMPRTMAARREAGPQARPPWGVIRGVLTVLGEALGGLARWLAGVSVAILVSLLASTTTYFVGGDPLIGPAIVVTLLALSFIAALYVGALTCNGGIGCLSALIYTMVFLPIDFTLSLYVLNESAAEPIPNLFLSLVLADTVSIVVPLFPTMVLLYYYAVLSEARERAEIAGSRYFRMLAGMVYGIVLGRASPEDLCRLAVRAMSMRVDIGYFSVYGRVCADYSLLAKHSGLGVVGSVEDADRLARLVGTYGGAKYAYLYSLLEHVTREHREAEGELRLLNDILHHLLELERVYVLVEQGAYVEAIVRLEELSREVDVKKELGHLLNTLTGCDLNYPRLLNLLSRLVFALSIGEPGHKAVGEVSDKLEKIVGSKKCVSPHLALAALLAQARQG